MPEAAAAIETGVGLVLAAFGARGSLLAAPDPSGFELAAKADGLLLRMRSEAAAGLLDRPGGIGTQTPTTTPQPWVEQVPHRVAEHV